MSTVFITGTNRGIGFGLGRHYAADGWTTIACCRNPAKANALNDLADQSDGLIQVDTLDLGDHASIDALAKKYSGQPSDVLINNAAIVGPRDPNMVQFYRQKFGTSIGNSNAPWTDATDPKAAEYKIAWHNPVPHITEISNDQLMRNFSS